MSRRRGRGGQAASHCRGRGLAGVVCAAALASGCASGTGAAPGGSAPGSSTPPAASSTPPASGSAAAAQPGQPRVLARDLSVPWAIAFLPGGDALVTERDTARLLRVTPHGTVTVAGTVPGVAPGGEGGLLGVAVSPSFQRDRLVYVYLSAQQDNRIARFRYVDGDIGPLDVLVTGIPRAAIHNGGRLTFGPDGMLWAGTGEHGEPGLAQDKDSLGGKILRMTPDGKPAPGNPFGTLVWSYGHRNVQGLAFDADRRLYAAELGQDSFDEVNRIERGRNYGWPEVEGRGGEPRFTDPAVTWSPSQASPSGAAIAGGSLWVAALRGERLWQVPLTADGSTRPPAAHFTGEFGRLRAVVQAPDGNLWAATSNKDGRGSPHPGDDKILVIPLR